MKLLWYIFLSVITESFALESRAVLPLRSVRISKHYGQQSSSDRRWYVRKDMSSLSMGVYDDNRGTRGRRLYFPSLEPSSSTWNTANTLTIARVVSIPFFITAIAQGKRPLSVLVFVLSCITDFIDGYIARRFEQTSSFGAFLDPVADKLLVASALILLMLHISTIPFAISVSLIICREIIVSALREWMAERNKRAEIKVGYLGKVKTAFQMISTVLLLAFAPGSLAFPSFKCPQIAALSHSLYPTGLLLFYTSTVLTVWTGLQYFLVSLPSLCQEER